MCTLALLAVATPRYQTRATLEPGRTSWTLPLDAVRLGLAVDPTAVTGAQVREVVIGSSPPGTGATADPDILVVFEAGYDLTRLAWLLADRPAEVPCGCAATG